jgi:hypothetical protein
MPNTKDTKALPIKNTLHKIVQGMDILSINLSKRSIVFILFVFDYNTNIRLFFETTKLFGGFFY